VILRLQTHACRGHKHRCNYQPFHTASFFLVPIFPDPAIRS